MPSEPKTDHLYYDCKRLFALLASDAWVQRKVQHVSCHEDDRYDVSISLDTDFDTFSALFESDQESQTPLEINGTLPVYDPSHDDRLPVPVGCVDKSTLFADFDLRDKDGSALRLTNQWDCAYYDMMALCGGVIYEAEIAKQANANPELVDREEKSPLFLDKVFHERFQRRCLSKEMAPRGGRAASLDEQLDEAFESLIAERDRIELDKFERRSKPTLNVDAIDAGSHFAETFKFYRTHSLVFRFLVELLFQKSVLWTSVDTGGSRFEVIKYRYTVNQDFLKYEQARDERHNKRWKIFLEIPSDDLPLTPIYNLEVSAPAATLFYPLEDARAPKGLSWFRRHSRARGEDADTGRGRAEEAASAAEDDDITPVGVMEYAHEYGIAGSSAIPQRHYVDDDFDVYVYGTFSRASVIAWVLYGKRQRRGSWPFRRIPTPEDTLKYRHRLYVSVTPQTRKRFRVYSAVTLLSLLFWIMFTCYCAAGRPCIDDLRDVIMPVFGIFIPLLSMGFAVQDDVGIHPRVFFRAPWLCCLLCLLLDFVVAGFALVGTVVAASGPALASVLAWIAGFAGVGGSGALFAIIWYWHICTDLPWQRPWGRFLYGNREDAFQSMRELSFIDGDATSDATSHHGKPNRIPEDVRP